MTLTQVSSAGIADGAIVNADINNSAAVALSKLSTSGTASSSNYLRGDGAWSAIDLSTKLNLTGGTLTGNVIHNDSVKSLFGTDSDLEVYHSGSHGYIKNTTNYLYHQSTQHLFLNAAGSETQAKFLENNACELYYDSSLKAYTNSGGFALVSHLIMGDDDIIKLGNGADLQIYHSGSDSWITDAGTGNLYLSSNGAGINLGKGDSSAFEAMIRAYTDGGVELYYDNSKKLSTLASGIKVERTDGTNSYITLATSDGDCGFLYANSNTDIQLMDREGHPFLKGIKDGAVELYHDNVLRAQTTNVGLHVTDILSVPDNGKLRCGNGDDLEIFHDGNNNLFLGSPTILLKNSANSESYIRCNENAAVELYYDNSQRLATSSTGIWVSGAISGESVDLADSKKILLGSHDDLELYHDGGNSIIADVGTGILALRGSRVQLESASGSEALIDARENSHVSLYYDNSQKFYTQSDKCVVAGHFYPESNNSYNLGHSSYRWANLYVNDMHFSNSPENTNSVDGTWGDWTLQEGDENIFMINNRTGKRYKMGLQEVD